MQGEENAFLELMNRYKKISNFYISKYKGLLEEFYDLNDLKQIGLIALYQAILTFNECMECSFSTYYGILLDRDLCMCLRDLAKESNRSNYKAIRLDECVQENEGVYRVDLIKNERVDYDPKKNMDLIVYKSLLDKELSSLDSVEKEIFKLWSEGYRYDEMSSILKVDKKKIDNTVQKIKKLLKRRLTM